MNNKVSAPNTAGGTRLGLLRAGLAAMLVLLFLQFALGMWVNLYVSIPQLSTGYGMGGMMGAMMAIMFSAGAPTLMVHMMLGWLMAAGAVAVFALSLLQSRAFVTLLSTAGIVSVLLGGLGGLLFLFSGGNNVYSYLMALAFASAFSTYFSALVYAK